MFKQQLIGSITVSLPLIAIFYNFPVLLQNPYSPIFGGIILGAYIWHLNYKNHTTLEKGLLYEPSGTHKELFEGWIRLCNINPTTIRLRYAYTAQQIAMAMSRTIVIDPTTCVICSDDTNATPVVNVFTQIYAPGLNTLQKERQASQSQLTPAAQSFFFKHELGHIADNYSYKKLWIIFMIGSASTAISISTIKLLLPFAGSLIADSFAVLAGLFVGMFFDLFFTYSSNYFFKVSAEKRADQFAAKHSTAQEITDVAHFFGKEQEIIEKYKDPNSLLLRLPSTILSGHPTGKIREAYLLKLAEDKKS